MRGRVAALALIVIALVGIPASAQQQRAPARTPDILYVPTPQEVVDAMLKAASVTKGDVVYDLGSGDGRLPITAARVHGARAVGIDIDPQRISEANANAKTAGVTDRVRFIEADLFESNIGEASVVTLYLLGSLNLKLLPKLNKELKPGTRVVSHAFDMGPTIKPKATMDVGGRTIYLYTVPIQ